MEARLIGLGVSFTTCVNLYCDGQEFTRGNSINYWNSAVEVVLDLPRPLRKCGVVFLKTKTTESSRFFRVRPDLLRRALCWLIENNPLYKNVRISEENLAALQHFDVANDIPSVSITDEEAQQLRIDENRLNREPELGILTESTPSTTCEATAQASDSLLYPCEISNSTCATRTDTISNTTGPDCITSQPDVMDNLVETFELERDEQDTQSELEKIVQAANLACGESDYPVQELQCRTDPIDEYKTKTLMQNCFPTLFPDAKAGLTPLESGESRIHEYHLAEYCAHLMKWHDRRFVIHGNFKFFCLNLIQRRQIDGLVRRVSETEQQNDSPQPGPSNADTDAALQILESLKPYFRVVRGSGLYWSNVRDDLMSMIGSRVLPTRWPTFFLTLSAADTIWPDFFKACNPQLTFDECRRLSAKDRRRLLNENPDIAARYFHHRFKCFFDNVLCGSEKPLGEIDDFFWRVEFQQRGSPHIHALLWIKDAPDVLELSKTDEGKRELAEFVDRSISVLSETRADLDACNCSTCAVFKAENLDILAVRPPEYGCDAWNCDLSRIVHRVQQHICYPGAACRKKTSECRFGYPKELQPHTEIDASIASDGTPSFNVRLKRESASTNNYTPALLSTWRANMDVQLIGNAYGAAEYTAAYVSKAEPDTVRFKKVIAAAVKRCDVNLPHHAILKRVANAALSIREISAQEAYFILLRELPLHGKSRTVERVKVLRHHMRCYRVDTRKQQELAVFADKARRTTCRLEPFERAYMARPTTDAFDSMSYATFVENYDLHDKVNSLSTNQDCWKRTDGCGYIKKRAKPRVIRASPWKAPDVHNPDFCYGELFLHVPWRTLDDLPQEDDECIEYFLHEQEKNLDNELLQESNAKIARQHSLDLLRQSHASPCCEQLPPSEYVFVEQSGVCMQEEDTCSLEVNTDDVNKITTWIAKHKYSEEDVQRAKIFMKDCVKPWMKERDSLAHSNPNGHTFYRYPITDEEDTSVPKETMSESQWIPFALAMKQSRIRLKAAIEGTPCTPIQMIINGEGGTGKSWLIDHLVKDTRWVFKDLPSSHSQRILLLAHQGTAAFNIKGQTVCSALGFSSFSRTAFSSPYTSLTSQKNGANKLKNLQQRYKDVHLVIIDEFSVISCGMLYWIDQRMREIWPQQRSLPFGGRDIIFTGDAAQLDPVVPYALATPLEQVYNEVQRKGRELWEGIPNVCLLTDQNRGKRDPEWFSALRRLRSRKPTEADIDLFNSRCSLSAGEPDWYSKAKHIAHKNVDVDAANAESLLANEVPIVHINALHHVQQKRLHQKRDIPEGTVSALISEAKTTNNERDRVVATKMMLCVGAPVTLTFNLEQSAGLCNGTNGIVYDLIFYKGSELPIILIKVTDLYLGPSFLKDVPNIVPIMPKEITWGKKNSDLRVVRRGIPLRLAYAMTIHKVQGLTCDKVVFHTNSIPTVSFAYVALSRVKHRNSIFLTQPLTLAKLNTPPEKIARFEAEEARVAAAVTKTLETALPVIQAMKLLAQLHNSAVLPRA